MSESDLEFVERFRAQWKDQGKLVGADRHRLLSLARRGAETQWRPIAEAPKTGIIIGWSKPEGQYRAIDNPSGGWLLDGTDLDNARDMYGVPLKVYPTHFILLSALGEPG